MVHHEILRAIQKIMNIFVVPLHTMLASIASKRIAAVTTARRFLSTEVPIKQVASVLKFNVGNEENAVKIDEHFAKMNTMMKVPPCHLLLLLRLQLLLLQR